MTNKLTLSLLTLAACLVFSLDVARASTASQILNLTGGKRTRIVWERDMTGGGVRYALDAAHSSKLVGYDTQDDTIRVILDAQASYHRPLITRDGGRVVYTDIINRRVYVVNWDGTAKRQLVSSNTRMGELWYDESSGKQYALIQKEQSGDDPILLVDIDNPSDQTEIWRSPEAGTYWLGISQDGRYMSSTFPWPYNGLADLRNGTWVQYADGCWTNVAPDDSYRVFLFTETGGHREVDMWDAGETNRRTIYLADAPGIGGNEIYHPHWTNDVRFMVMTGPYPTGSEWNTYAGVEVHFGKFNSSFTAVTDWVVINSDSRRDYYPDAWIDPGALAPAIALDKTSLSFSAVEGGGDPSPKIVKVTNSGGGTLSNVTVAENAGWLTVDRTGSGNDQTLSNNVSVSGLSAGTHNATVTVSGGGAANSVQYTVTLSVSAQPTLTTIEVDPSSATVAPSGQVSLTSRLKDQGGSPIAGVVTWSVTGGGSMSPQSSGTAVTQHTSAFTSDGTLGAFTVTAASGGVQGTATVTVSALHMKINCGANDRDVAGWERDDGYVSGGGDYTWDRDVDVTGVQDAAPQGVYRSVRCGSPHSYSFPVPDGTYVLRLHFADAYGGRAARYTVEGNVILENFDVVTEAGGTYKALVKEFTITVGGGDGLQMLCEKGPENDAFECGIEIFEAGAATNQPPAVGAGPDATVELGAQAFLQGTITDDGLPGTGLTCEWSARQGPGSVTFAEATSAATTADLSAVGTYVLRLTASDGELTGYDEITITVTEPSDPVITLVSPDGGEVWYAGTTRYITWSTVNLTHVSIYYSTNGGSTVEEIAPTVTESDPEWLNYPWVVPDEPSTQCLVFMSGYFGEAPTQSADFFEIRSATDTDGDGLDDAWEIANFGDLTHDGAADTDADGLTDLQEFQHGTDPRVPDTDGDGMPDKWEIDYGLDPTVDDAGLDPDGDGSTNYQEFRGGSDPHDATSLPSSDGAGVGFGCATRPEEGALVVLALLLLVSAAFAANTRPATRKGRAEAPRRQGRQVALAHGFEDRGNSA